MSAISRGARNTFRNPLRTIPIVVILGISLGLVVVMLAARSAVTSRIAEVKASIGNTITVMPAGVRGFQGGGEPLTNAHVEALAKIANVSRVDATIDSPMMSGTDTSLEPAVEAGTLGKRVGRVIRFSGPESGTASGNDEALADFKLPIMAVGTNNVAYGGEMLSADIVLSSGSLFDAAGDENAAVIGKALAEKNSLAPSSTFTAYDETVTVSGVYDAGNEFANNAVVFPLKTLQRLSSQSDQVTSAILRVDSVDHLDAAETSAKDQLGDLADVLSSKGSVAEAVEPLENIKSIATTSLWGALIAAAVITLLAMLIIVRERRKEIAVLKAIGAGDGTIITQFVSESVMLTLLGSVVGTALGIAASNPILDALLRSNGNGGPGPEFSSSAGLGPNAVRIAVGGFKAVRGAIEDLNAAIDFNLVLYGLLAAIAVAIVGSALPAWVIAKVRPAEVLRSE